MIAYSPSMLRSIDATVRLGLFVLFSLGRGVGLYG